MTQSPTETTTIPIAARIAGALLATACLAAMVWALIAVSIEYQFRGLPVLTDEEVDPQALARLAIELERLVRLDPNNGELRNAYASVLGRQRENTEAVAQLEQALKIQNAQNSLFFLAEMYDRLQRPEDAARTMADCVVINPSNAQFNQAWMRLLFNRMRDAQKAWESGQVKDRAAYDEARRRYAQAVRDWGVRAPHDPNSYLFMANYHVSQMKSSPPQFYLLQAYRLLLLGISGAPWQDLPPRRFMIEPRGAVQTIGDILRNQYAKPYKGLP